MDNKSKDGKKGHLFHLPKEHIDWVVHPITRFVKIEAAAGVVLLLFTVLALSLANSPLRVPFSHLWQISIGINIGPLAFERSLHGWINDAIMTLFFFLIALELKRELVLGELRNPRLAMLSISAALGGMLVPALIYLIFQYGESGQSGWGTVMATDTAFVIGCLALLGKNIPKSLRIFMLSLAVVDDIGAIIVVAVGYSSSIDWIAIGLGVAGFVVIRAMAFIGIRSITLFFIMGGLIWMVVDASGIHPTVTGVILGLMTPTTKWVSDDHLHAIMDRVVAYPRGDHWSGDTPDRQALITAEAAARETLSPVERLEIMLHPWVGFVVMPLFAFANAGIPLKGTSITSTVTIAVFLGFVLGKPVGIFLFSWIAVQLRIAILPKGLSWRMLFGGGMLAGIGFTMALFIANLAFSPEQINAVKLGILSASVFSALVGLTLLRYFSLPTNITHHNRDHSETLHDQTKTEDKYFKIPEHEHESNN
ncbi:Na+/H+ antiporter NhaA [Gynuella sunshinyii]|uniref:Na(+)/H(+) antiporter NhaA n=1 Tax=Gynuella sunshinyii YC6258 TaxID=1445510 RepID=A0A0C5VMI8_9GAMM|nr:Na+/H+ antiporter NhaA [Gynuella sunshinyii]AJQ95531.1 Na+/H+ antiporter [Gynuella sunshinyii YC6258]